MVREEKNMYFPPKVRFLDLELEKMIAASLGQLPVDDWIDDDF